MTRIREFRERFETPMLWIPQSFCSSIADRLDHAALSACEGTTGFFRHTPEMSALAMVHCLEADNTIF